MGLVRDTLITFSTHVIRAVLAILTAIIVARVLGPSGKGTYELIVLVPTLLLFVGNLGLGMANTYFGGKGKYEWTDIVSNSLVSAAALGTLLTVIFLVCFLGFRPPVLKELDPRLATAATLALPFSLLTMYLGYVLLGQKRIKEFNIVSLMQRGALLILMFSSLLLLKGGIFDATLAWVTATIIAAFVGVLFVRQSTDIRWCFHPLLFKDSIKFGIQGYLGNMLQFLNYRLDMFLIAFFMGVRFVGLYSVAVVLAEALWYFPSAVGTVVFARTPGLSTKQSDSSTPAVCRSTLFLTFFLGLGLFVVSKPLIILFFGSSFLPAIRPLWILLPGVVALSVSKVLASEITGRGKPIIGTIAAGVSLLVNVSLNLLLIPKIGILGASLASTVSYSVTAAVVLFAFMRISKSSLPDTVIIKLSDIKMLCSTIRKKHRLALLRS